MKKRKSRKRHITDEEFQEALDNIDNQKIIHAACTNYMASLSSDELKQCGLDALWRALQSHNPSFKRKFTTSLFKFVKWECNNAARAKYGDRIQAGPLRGDIPADDSAVQNAILVEELLEYLDEMPRQILRDRYISNHTLQEIADMYGYTAPGIQYIINKALKELREVDVGV